MVTASTAPFTVVIPARLASTRLPGKLLLEETGRPLLAHTIDRAHKAEGVTNVLVAADDVSLVEAAEAAGARAVLTNPALPSGTDRVAAAIAAQPELSCDIIVNVQGDEPEIEPAAISYAAHILGVSKADVATLVTPFPVEPETGPGSPADPSAVKAVLGRPRKGGTWRQAYAFTRAPAPYPRNREAFEGYFQHLGLYAFQRSVLERFAVWAPSLLERIEGLEQWRFLENDAVIACGVVEEARKGIDTPEDYAAFVARWRGLESVAP
jgi:3-deoxy-manno-octulosonate cytidylyltransferase (CMP-KDO synthetase)